jgi:hypothetical protein
MKHSILNTAFAKNYNLELLAKHGANELQGSIQLDMTPEEYLSLVKAITPISRSAISDLFSAVKTTPALTKISFMSSVLRRNVNLPEVLTIDDITINGRQIPNVKQERFKGAWTNINTMVSNTSKDRFANITVTAANELMASVVRGLYCMSYDETTEWLNPKSSAFLIEVYARMMEHILNRLYKLDVIEAAVVRYGFAYYYASLLTDKRDAKGAPEILNRCTGLFKLSNVSMDSLSERMQAITGDEVVDLNHVAQFVVANGPSRANGFTSGNIYRMIFTSSRSSLPTYIAVDYPPYFLYLLLRVTSGDKHPLLTNMMNTDFTRPRIADELATIVHDKHAIFGN